MLSFSRLANIQLVSVGFVQFGGGNHVVNFYHVGICANETADVLAKQMAQDIVWGRIAAPSYISMQSALNLSSEIAYN